MEHERGSGLKLKKLLQFKHFPITDDLRLDLNRIVWGASLGLIFFQVLMGAPFAGFVRNLGVGDFMFGLLMALPVMGGLFQLLAAYWLECSGARKRTFLIAGVLQRFVIIPMVLLPYLLPNAHPALLIGLIMVLLAVSSVGGAFMNVAFFSWMAAIVPIGIRGRFFSQRQLFFTATGLIGGLLVSLLLDVVPGNAGFALVFTLATILALLDIACFLRVSDPPMDPPQEPIRILKVWKEAFTHPNFRRYLIFWSVWIFGLSIAAPFFADYMISYLELSYLQITLYTQTIFSVFTILSVRFWGNMIDSYGNKPVMRICGIAVFLAPVLWCLTTPSFTLMIPIIHMLAGIFWSGTELTAANLMMGLSPDKNRSFYIASFALVSSLVGSILAYLTGGLLMELTRGWILAMNIQLLGYPMNNYHMLFLLSGVIRLAAVLLFLPAVEEEAAHPVSAVLRHIVRAFSNKVKGLTM